MQRLRALELSALTRGITRTVWKGGWLRKNLSIILMLAILITIPKKRKRKQGMIFNLKVTTFLEVDSIYNIQYTIYNIQYTIYMLNNNIFNFKSCKAPLGLTNQSYQPLAENFRIVDIKINA